MKSLITFILLCMPTLAMAHNTVILGDPLATIKLDQNQTKELYSFCDGVFLQKSIQQDYSDSTFDAPKLESSLRIVKQGQLTPSSKTSFTFGVSVLKPKLNGINSTSIQTVNNEALRGRSVFLSLSLRSVF